jgi:hypothetical protein
MNDLFKSIEELSLDDLGDLLEVLNEMEEDLTDGE